MKKTLIITFVLIGALLKLQCATCQEQMRQTLSKEALMDKIKGGWAGQTIGVTFGGPTEFHFQGSFIPDQQPIVWHDGYLKMMMENHPALYDDIYMDLTFVEVLERVGLAAPADSFALAFAHAEYPLWHANQAARYNLLNGLRPPESGHWLNNPHADDIDFQIEADFAGLMSPGMPNAAAAICDKVGHIMNYGDGWYGGVYVSAMYTLAFISDDVNYIVKEALRAIPEQSDFRQCISDVIAWHAQFPEDWKQTWFEIQKKWAFEVGCPDGVFAAYNIDAKINAAYIVLGLLYGQGDYTRTLEISTRAGQDSDCNPSNAAGILGTMLGYDRIPGYWKMGLSEIEGIQFRYTNISLNDAYRMSYKHALDMIAAQGGQIADNYVILPLDSPKPVHYERGFEGTFPVARKSINQSIDSTYAFSFEGTGFVLRGSAEKKERELPEYVFDVEWYLNGEKVAGFTMPTDFKTRRHEVLWKYKLPKGQHDVQVKVSNPHPDYTITLRNFIVYSDEPSDGFHQHTAQ